jgi:hypothetical protein
MADPHWPAVPAGLETDLWARHWARIEAEAADREVLEDARRVVLTGAAVAAAKGDRDAREFAKAHGAISDPPIDIDATVAKALAAAEQIAVICARVDEITKRYRRPRPAANR